MPKTIVPPAPMPDGMRFRPSRSAPCGSSRPACRSCGPRRSSTQKRTIPATNANALSTCSARIQSSKLTPTLDPMTMDGVESTARHLRLLTETIAAVNSSLDLQEVLELVASKVADALGTDACFVYLYDERADELVLRATHGTRVEELTRTPRMRPGEGITGVAAAERAPVMIAEQAHLDPRFKQFPNLPEDEYESILAVPIIGPARRSRARSTSGRASRGRSPRPRSSSSSRSRHRSRRRSSTRSSTSARSGGSPSWRRSRASPRPFRSRCTSRSRSRRS